MNLGITLEENKRGLEVGDKVKVINENSRAFGLTGTIRDFAQKFTYCAVLEMDEPFDGWDCHGKIPSNRGWNVDTAWLEKVE